MTTAHKEPHKAEMHEMAPGQPSPPSLVREVMWPHKIAQGGTRSHKTAQDRTSQHKIAQDSTRWHKAAQDRTRSHKMAQDGTSPHKAAQDRTRSHKMAQDCTRPHNNKSIPRGIRFFDRFLVDVCSQLEPPGPEKSSPRCSQNTTFDKSPIQANIDA